MNITKVLALEEEIIDTIAKSRGLEPELKLLLIKYLQMLSDEIHKGDL